MKDEVILQSVKDLKAGQFGVTAIKVELEADLCRYDTDEEMVVHILQNVADQLSVEITADTITDEDEDHEYACSYNALPGLVYIRGYNDGSVDSEITFTVSLDKPENIKLLPMFVQAWRDYCSQQSEFDVDGAGMHMALLNTSDCSYPSNPTHADYVKFNNFRHSMIGLLPALYFLGTHNDATRSMEYRRPNIDVSDNQHGYSKFNAVSYSRGAVEFRVFDTCYDEPAAILDNVVVMRNAMRFWTTKYKSSGLGKFGSIEFGNDSGRELKRLYNSVKHLDVLNAGLIKLKPAYKSIRELKSERSFNVNRRTFKSQLAKIQATAALEYEEYAERCNWSVNYLRPGFISDYIRNHNPGDITQIMPQAEKYADDMIESNRSTWRTRANFIAGRISEYSSPRNDYSLEIC